MRKNILKGWISLVLILAILSSGLIGCSGKSEDKKEADAPEKTQQEQLSTIEFSYFPGRDASVAQRLSAENPNDVVTPYIEKKFRLKLKEVIQPIKGQPNKQMLSQWIAAGNVPDVVEVSTNDYPIFALSGQFAELTEYLKKMPNYNKYYDQKYWSRVMVDGKIYAISEIGGLYPETDDANDPYVPARFGHGFWVREDILAKAGYKFTPYEQVKKATVDSGKKTTLEDLKIEPEIKTPEDLYALLKKIKDLNLKVGDKPVIPLSIMSWAQFHMGAMFDWGHWRIDGKGNVDGFFGLPGAKDYYKWLTKLYREGLIDQDFVIQKPEQLQEKISSGRVAAGMWMPDLKSAQTALGKIDPSMKIRYFSFPKVDPTKGFYDVVEPGGFWKTMIRKDFKGIDRLTQYYDWLLSDEGMDIRAWGPESAGLWVMKDGKKVFKDKTIENDVLNHVRNANGADKFGLYDTTVDKASWSRLVAAAPQFLNLKGYERSYPPKIDFDEHCRNIAGGAGYNLNLSAAVGDNTDLTSKVSAYFWGEFQDKEVAKLLVTKNDEEFDKIYDDIVKSFKTKTNYEEAQKAMKKWFEKFPPIK